MGEVALDFPRLWIEFPDPDAPRDSAPHQVFRCDVTWLTSNYECIFGRGCHGILQSSPEAGCCTLGAHFADKADEARVATHVAKLSPEQWQLRPHRRTRLARADWVEVDAEGSRTTRVVDAEGERACIFHNRRGYAGGYGCALHLLALRDGEDPIRTKPDVCWQLPLRRTYRDVERPDGSTYLEVSIGEYDRRGWGAGGVDLDWYCTGSPEARVGAEPIYVSLAAELTELIGAAAYAELARHCTQILDAGTSQRPGSPVAPHPADGS